MKNPKIESMEEFLLRYKDWGKDDWKKAFVGAHLTCEYFRTEFLRLEAELTRYKMAIDTLILEDIEAGA